MTTTLVKVSAEFKSIDGNKWYGLEGTVDPGETPLEAFKKAESIVREAGRGESEQSTSGGSSTGNRLFAPPYRPEPEKPTPEEIIAEIEACNKITEKNTYGREIGLLAYFNETEPRIKEAYEKRLRELS